LSIKDKYFLLIHTALRQDYFRKDNNKDALDKLIKLKRSNKPSDIGAVVESLVNSDLLCPSTSQLDQDRNIYSYLKNGKNNIENLERYDLDALNNYISKAHHLVANDYTNSMFTQKYPDVTGFSYMNNDIMIVEYKDIFLVCPVLDMSDNWAQKIIVLDRAGNIQLKDSLD
jgi:DNA-binding MarR family transcriptional regulator